jgi:toxin ParE1/3/4
VGNRFRKREQVDVDLDSIWSFIAADNVDAAHRQINRIGEVFEMLVQNPRAGRERPDIQRDLRSFPVGSYVIFYVSLPDGIEVVRVMHGRQDIDADDMDHDQVDSPSRAPPSTRSSRWIISERPEMPRMTITSGEERPLILSASSAS